jgi:hypothetical protein
MRSAFTKRGYCDGESGDRYLVGEDDLGDGWGKERHGDSCGEKEYQRR